MNAVDGVLRVIERLVEGTRGGLIKLSIARIKRVAAESGVLVGKEFERAVYKVLHVMLADCKAYVDVCMSLRNRKDKAICYVYNLECVKQKLAAAAV